MSKYCTLKDRPISVATTLDGREEIWGGCMLYGVWHKCENCPNVIEVGDTTYSASKAEESAKKACPDDGFGGNLQHIGFYRKAFADGYEKAQKGIATELKTIISVSKEGWLESNIKKFIEELEEGR